MKALMLLLVLLVGCQHAPSAPTGLRIVEPEPASQFDICDPPRGEAQDETRMIHGKGFNSVKYGCL